MNSITIKISQETKERLKKRKLIDEEPYNKIIKRLLDQTEEKSNGV